MQSVTETIQTIDRRVLPSADGPTALEQSEPVTDGGVSVSDEAYSPTSEDARNVREARDAINAFSFFASAIAGQMGELYDKLAHVEIATSTDEFYSRLAAVEAERDQAVHASIWYKEQFEQMQRDVAAMRDDLDRQRVTFADHHAAKQEIARLRAELEGTGSSNGDGSHKQESTRRWLFGKAS